MTSALKTKENQESLQAEFVSFLPRHLRLAISSYDTKSCDYSICYGEWSLPKNVPEYTIEAANRAIVHLNGLLLPVEKKTLYQWLTLLATLCAGQMTAQDARSKIAALGTMLAKYPKGVFTMQTIDLIAKNSKWLPSYAEICAVLDGKKAEIESALYRCKKLVENQKVIAQKETNRKFLPKEKWTKDQWIEYVNEAKNMLELAQTHRSLINVNEWEAEVKKRLTEAQGRI